MITTPESLHIKRQLDLLRMRQNALRIALRLFEAAENQNEINEISQWFEQCNVATYEETIRTAIEELLKLARAKNLSIRP